MTTPARRRLAKCDYWIERQYGGRRIYWCWLIAVGAMGQSVTYRTLIGKRPSAREEAQIKTINPVSGAPYPNREDVNG